MPRASLLRAAAFLTLLPSCQSLTGLSDLDFSVEPGAASGGAGASGSAGEGQGGSSGGAGSSGASGSSGSGGSAGASGSAGVAGSGGVAGSAGASGSAGGSSGGMGGQAGTAGASGSSGSSGSSGAAGSGGMVDCTKNAGPTAIIKAPPTAAADVPFTLDGSGSKDPDSGDSLTYAWSADAGAPAPDMPKEATTSVTATACNSTVKYTLTVTDACGHSASASALVAVGSGPDVSATTCISGDECGSPSKPYCTIAKGLAMSPVSFVRVASAKGQAPYAEAVTMVNGKDLLGGFDPSFTKPRELDPAESGAAIEASSTAVVHYPTATSGKLEGFTLRMAGLLGDERAAVLIEGTAQADVAHINVAASPSFGLPSSSYGVWLVTSSGAVTVSSSTLTPPQAGTTSAGLFVDPTSTGSLTLDGVSATGGSAPQSFGVAYQGLGPLKVTGGVLAGGKGGTRSAGLWASSETTSPATVTLDGVSALGGASPLTVGVDAQLLSSVSIKGGTIDGQGLPDAAAESYGVRANGIGELTVEGASVVGQNPSSQLTVQSIGVGVSLSVPVGATAKATLTNTNVEGAKIARTRIGIDDTSVPLLVDGGTVQGSSTNGGVEVTGVRVNGALPEGSIVEIANASLIAGGVATAVDAPYQVYGVHVVDTATVHLHDNAALRGCLASCSGTGTAQAPAVAAGVRLDGGQKHELTNNKLIVGGPHLIGATANTFHAGVLATPPCAQADCSGVELSLNSNGTISGNDGLPPSASPEKAAGVSVSAAKLDVLGGTIFGGRAIQTVVGVEIAAAARPSSAKILSADVRGGRGPTRSAGIATEATSSLIIKQNVVQACGIDGTSGPSQDCINITSSVGLELRGDESAVVSNNFVFGGFGLDSVGCSVEAASGSVSLIYNLCFAQGYTGAGSKAVGLRLGGYAGSVPSSLGIIDNILMTGQLALPRYAVEETVAGITGLTFHNNDLPPDTGVSSPQIALYLRKGLNGDLPLDSIDDVNMLEGASKNQSITPEFASASPYAPSAKGYQQADSCTLKGLAEQVPSEPFDYKGTMRGATATDLPEIGPDECQ